MRFLSAADWSKLGLENERLRFLYERWAELLDQGVPLSFRAPIMSGLCLLREFAEVEASFRATGRGKAAVLAVSEEAFGTHLKQFFPTSGTVQQDQVISELAPDLLRGHEESGRHFISGNTPDHSEIRRIATVARLVLQRLEGSYVTLVFSKLRELVFGSKESDTVAAIDRILTGLVSHLLASGFSDSLLRYHLRMLHSAPGDDGGEESRFDVFVRRLEMGEDEIRVVIRAQASSDLWENWPEALSNPRSDHVLEPGVEEPVDWEAFRKPVGGVRFIPFSLRARDHHAAARLAYQQLQAHADVAFIRSGKAEPGVQQVATIRHGGRMAIEHASRMQLDDLPVPLGERQRAQDQEHLVRALISPDVQESSKRRLSGALRYYRISIGQQWLESSFTNLWTSLEVLSSSEYHENIIERVVRSVVPIAAGRKVHDTLQAILGYLLGRKIHRDPWFAREFEDVSEDGRIQVHLLLRILADPVRVESLASHLSADSPLLAWRLRNAHVSLRTGHDLGCTVYRTARRIEWQVRRLYRLRNDIVHGAAVTPNSKRLLTHLQTYVYESLLTIGALLGASNGLCTIEDGVTAADALFHAWLAEIRSAGPLAHIGEEHACRIAGTPYQGIA